MPSTTTNTIEPGTQPADVEAAESSMFRTASSNEFLDSFGPLRTEMGPIEYVPQSVRTLQGTPSSMRSLSCSSYEEAAYSSERGQPPPPSGTPGAAGSSGFGGESGGGGGATPPPPTPPLTPGTHRRTNSATSVTTGQRPQRLVAVRYFLDRPGYGLHNSAVRMWFEPPARCTPHQLSGFLKEQGIALDDLLVEVYLDRFQSFMLLEACEAASIEWNLRDTTPEDPGILNIRLTDVSYAARLDEDLSKASPTGGGAPAKQQSPAPAAHPHANTTPVGLFSFAMMVGLETAEVMSTLVPNFVSPKYVMAWGPYMYFVGGMLQIFTATLQVLRNNIYGAVAFYGFGSFWFSNGTKVILETFFYPTAPEDEIQLLEEADPWGGFIRAMYILAFTMALLKQTFVMSKLSTTLISLLCCKIACQAVAGWSDTMKWMQVVFGWITSWFAFYVFLVEFTNQVYHREVFKTHKWSVENSPEEVFGAAGKSQTLYSKAARLRQARFPTISTTRGAMRSKRHKQQHRSTHTNTLSKHSEEGANNGENGEKID